MLCPSPEEGNLNLWRLGFRGELECCGFRSPSRDFPEHPDEHLCPQAPTLCDGSSQPPAFCFISVSAAASQSSQSGMSRVSPDLADKIWPLQVAV